MIQLNKYEKQWIKLIKMHYKDKYPVASNWINTLKPMFEEIYGWGAKEHYNDFLNCIFGKLLDIHLKIQLDESGTNHQLKSIFSAAFYKSISRNHRKPIERAIAELCGEIQCNQVIVDGVHRYELN